MFDWVCSIILLLPKLQTPALVNAMTYGLRLLLFRSVYRGMQPTCYDTNKHAEYSFRRDKPSQFHIWWQEKFHEKSLD